MDSIHDYIAGIILIFLMIIYLITFILRSTLSDLPSNVRYVDAYEMKTGDLVCISYNNLPGHIVASLTNSAWTHTGMIWVDPKTNIRYVLEGAICRQSEYKNFYKIPVVSWMNLNRHSTLGFKSYVGPPVDPIKMIETFEPMTKYCKLEGFRPAWMRFLFNDPYQELTTLKPRYTCFESTLILGQECGIFSHDRMYSSYFPCHIVNDQVKMPKGTYYTKVIQMIQNPLQQKMLVDDMKKFPDFWKTSYKMENVNKK